MARVGARAGPCLMASLLIDRVPGWNPGRQKQKPRAFSGAGSRFFRPGFGGATYTNPIPAPGWTVIRTSTRTAATRPRSDAGTEAVVRSEEHTSELQSQMRNSYAVFC